MCGSIRSKTWLSMRYFAQCPCRAVQTDSYVVLLKQLDIEKRFANARRHGHHQARTRWSTDVSLVAMTICTLIINIPDGAQSPVTVVLDATSSPQGDTFRVIEMCVSYLCVIYSQGDGLARSSLMTRQVQPTLGHCVFEEPGQLRCATQPVVHSVHL